MKVNAEEYAVCRELLNELYQGDYISHDCLVRQIGMLQIANPIIDSISMEFHLKKFHELVNYVRIGYPLSGHLYVLDNQGMEALFAAQERLIQLEKELINEKK